MADSVLSDAKMPRVSGVCEVFNSSPAVTPLKVTVTFCRAESDVFQLEAEVRRIERQLEKKKIQLRLARETSAEALRQCKLAEHVTFVVE